MITSVAKFPLLYHAHHNRHLEDLPFWLDLANRYGDPILELGCGSGRILLPLALDGRQVIGIDNDSGMLSVLRRNIPPGTPPVHFFLADFSAFSIARRFSLILMPCNTFSTLPAMSRAATLNTVVFHLTHEGVFAVSMPNPILLKSLPRRSEPEIEETFPHPIDNQPVQVSSAWERKRQKIDFIWHYDHLLPDGRVDRLTAVQRQHLVTPEGYFKELAIAGLRVTQAFGNYDLSAFTSSSPNLIILARLSDTHPSHF